MIAKMIAAIALGFTSAFGAVAFLFFVVSLSTLFGGFGGWVVGIVVPSAVDVVREIVGVECTDFQLGAAFGFMGSFLKTSVSKD